MYKEGMEMPALAYDGILPFVSLTGPQLKGYYLFFKDTYLVNLIDIL
ncbi:MAG: hypothetical protein K0S80_2696 [Neobacillus sp.]|nr:hypothetical protein [Neobacillus sp.]